MLYEYEQLQILGCVQELLLSHTNIENSFLFALNLKILFSCMVSYIDKLNFKSNMVQWLVLNLHHKFCCFNIRYISSNILALNSLHFKICTFLLIYTPGLYINERNSRVMVMHIENFTKPHYLVLLMCKSNEKNQLSVFDSILLVYF